MSIHIDSVNKYYSLPPSNISDVVSILIQSVTELSNLSETSSEVAQQLSTLTRLTSTPQIVAANISNSIVQSIVDGLIILTNDENDADIGSVTSSSLGIVYIILLSYFTSKLCNGWLSDVTTNLIQVTSVGVNNLNDSDQNELVDYLFDLIGAVGHSALNQSLPGMLLFKKFWF